MAEKPESTELSGLRHTSDSEPGWSRRRRGRGFSYIKEGGQRLVLELERVRVQELAIPPAWTDVWICPNRMGHLQATGRDARGRKQYIYHRLWREHQNEVKYDRVTDFAKALPALRRRAARDLSRGSEVSRERVVAAVVRLLDLTLIRIGNSEYAEENGSYGLTTMEERHVRIIGPQIRFIYRGKSGRKHDLTLKNSRLARVVKQCRELPGQLLFSYEDSEGEARSVQSHDVNEYIREVTGGGHSAKDFRTWAGTVNTASALHASHSQITGKAALATAIASTAAILGNTPAVCQRSYVHPAVINSHEAGSFYTLYNPLLVRARESGSGGLTLHEAATLAFLAAHTA